jgi:hypothetical protein
MTETRYKRHIDTPMLSGQDPDGGLWFAAAYNVRDLIADSQGGIHNEGLEFAYQTAFIEVYTDNTNRPHGGNCCVVDIFTYFASPTRLLHEERRLLGRLGNKFQAEWSESSPWAGEVREAPWSHFIPDDAAPISLYRYTVDEEGMGYGMMAEGRGWSRHAVRWIRIAANALILARGPVRTSTGVLTYEGEYPLLEVAQYFINRGERSL